MHYSLNESVYEINTDPKSILVARIHRATSALGFPPDMTPNGLSLMESFDRKDIAPHAVIDTDHYIENRMPVDFRKLKTKLSMLHTGIKKVFNAITTKHAQNAWK